MNEYITKLDSSGNIEWQTNIGTLGTATQYRLRTVVDKSGNSYFTNANYLGKVDMNGNLVGDIINVPIDLGIARDVYCAGCLDRDGEYFYFATKDSTGFNYYLYKISTNNFVYTEITEVMTYNRTGSYATANGSLNMDIFGNIWADSMGYAYGNVPIIFNTVYNTTFSNMLISNSIICLDWRGIAWMIASQDTSRYFYRYIYNMQANTVAQTDMSSYLSYLYREWVIDGVCSKHYGDLFLLKNKMTDTTTACTIIRVNISDYNTPVFKQAVDTVYLGRDLVDCYGLIYDYQNSRILFSSYGVDGYDLYSLGITDANTMDSAPTLVKAGIGTKGVKNDYNGFFLSKYGNTGAGYSSGY